MINICSPTLDFLIFFLLEREREREGEREDVPSKESVIPLTPDSARLEGPFRK